MVIRPDKNVLNEHAKFSKFDKYKAEQKPDVMKVADISKMDIDISKAKEKLNWRPVWNLDKALNLIIDWQMQHVKGLDAQDISLRQIELYKKDFRN